MSNSLFSSLWYRVADLKPELRDHVQLHRQQYRGKTWYVLQNLSNGQHHRFNRIAYQMIGMMDGIRSVQQIWDQMIEHYQDDAPTQDETIKILGQLHTSDVMQCEISPDNAELFERFHNHNNADWKNILKSPLSLKIPLLDPDRYLNYFLPYAKPFFTKSFFCIWLLVVISALFLSLSHWQELTGNISDQILSLDNLLLISLLYPVIKIFHELGHAFATKVWGGEVHEMGIILLALIPNPYVNTSSATAFPQKNKRVIVSAAGMMVELLLASIALFIWLNIEPGVMRAVCFNVMLIASITTVLFNANPLIKFDGYYIFSDLIEIPNLAERSKKYLTYFVQRYLFGLSNSQSPTTAKGEEYWFVFYGITSFFYRMLILVMITLFIAGKFFFIGTLLALWVLFTQIILPIFKQASFLFTSRILNTKRQRAITVSFSFLLVIASIIFLLPLPNNTVTEGVIWLPEESQIRIKTEGFVQQVLVKDGQHVSAGTPLIKLHDPILVAEEKTQQAMREALETKLATELQQDKAKAAITRDEIASINAKLNHIYDLKKNLITTSQADGYFSILNDHDLTDRYLQKGDLIAYIIAPENMTARVVVSQEDIGLIRQNTQKIDIKMASNLSHEISARIKSEVPAASDQLPSLALGSQGGGSMSVNPSDDKGLQTLQKIFQLDLNLMQKPDLNFVGGRVYVKFNHGNSPMAERWYRSIRQLFLRQFDV